MTLATAASSGTALRGISSMATRALLAELQALAPDTLPAVDMLSVGGVDAARRVREGEALDVVVLASDALDLLLAAGHVRAGSKVDLVRSGVAVAVPAGAARPDIGSAEAVRRAVLAAPSVGYSTGPSGVALIKQFERWGILPELQSRLVQASPGVPVGQLVAQGQVSLGFQQLSELLHVPGIELLGPLPEAMQITTVFSAGICSISTQAEAAQALLAFWVSEATIAAKRRQGMEPV